LWWWRHSPTKDNVKVLHNETIKVSVDKVRSAAEHAEAGLNKREKDLVRFLFGNQKKLSFHKGKKTQKTIDHFFICLGRNHSSTTSQVIFIRKNQTTLCFFLEYYT